MDIKQYYRKLREVESALREPYELVVSVETPDGGKAGIMTEVGKPIAAKMIVEGCAVLANSQQKEKYCQQQAVARKAAQQAELARRLQIAVISNPDLTVSGADGTDNLPTNGRS